MSANIENKLYDYSVLLFTDIAGCLTPNMEKVAASWLSLCKFNIDLPSLALFTLLNIKSVFICLISKVQ